MLPYYKYYYIHQNDNSITSKPFDENLFKVIEIKKRIESKVKILQPNFFNYAQMSTLFTCVYLINKFARLDSVNRQKHIKLIENIKKEIKNRNKVIRYIGIKGKLQLYMILLNIKFYIKVVRFIRVKINI